MDRIEELLLHDKFKAMAEKADSLEAMLKLCNAFIDKYGKKKEETKSADTGLLPPVGIKPRHNATLEDNWTYAYPKGGGGIIPNVNKKDYYVDSSSYGSIGPSHNSYEFHDFRVSHAVSEHDLQNASSYGAGYVSEIERQVNSELSEKMIKELLMSGYAHIDTRSVYRSASKIYTLEVSARREKK